MEKASHLPCQAGGRGPWAPASGSARASGVAPDLVLEGHLHFADVAGYHGTEDHQIPRDRVAAELHCHLETRVLVVALTIVPGALLDVLPILQELVDAVNVPTYDRTPPGVLETLDLQVVHNVSHLGIQALLFPADVTIHRRNVGCVESARVHCLKIHVCAIHQVPHNVGPTSLGCQHQRGETLLIQAAVHVCPLLHAVLDPREVPHDDGVLELLVDVGQGIDVLAAVDAGSRVEDVPLLPRRLEERSLHGRARGLPPDPQPLTEPGAAWPGVDLEPKTA
mmetsp:Transcript_70953/g.224130  ORF Transcript_70953/g.224130 Transcript_70953/m.224130 type:complete len:280 (-) Transcript_70953:3-842(-)